MNTLYEEYAILNSQISELEDKKEQLREQIIERMKEEGEDKVETPVGKFTIAKLKKWTYPEEVLAIGERFKTEKALAESTGEATYVEQDSLKFTQIKL